MLTDRKNSSLEGVAAGEEQDAKSSPNVLDTLRQLVRQGIPIFAQDFTQVSEDVLRAMFYAVRAQMPNSYVIFPHDIDSLTNIGWLVDHDDFGLGESYYHTVQVQYHRGSEENGYMTEMQIQRSRFFGERLAPQIVTSRWELMRTILPDREFQKFPADFDILKWYSYVEFD